MKFCRIHPKAQQIPLKSHESDAGYDLTIIDIHKKISNKVTLYSTGIRYELPEGHYLELHARSSLMKQGYMLANGVGILDNSYRGEILVALLKFDEEAPEIQLPARVAQLILRKSVELPVEEVKEIGIDTDRGEGGFGSTNHFTSEASKMIIE